MNAVNVGLVTFIIQHNRIQGVFLLCKITNLLIYSTDDTVRSQKPENVRKGTRRGQSDDAPHRDPHESVFKGCRE